MTKWANSRCECPTGKSSLGVTVNSDTKCVDCPANSEPTADTTGCTCKAGYLPAWDAAEAQSCKVLVGTNQKLNDAKDGFDCNDNWIGAKCDVACTWANLKEATDKTKAKALTSCGCKDKFFGDACEIDCSADANATGTGLDSTKKRCACKDKKWYDGNATVCADTCAKVADSKVNTDTTACECKDGFLGDATVKCATCDKTKAAASCLCKDGFSGDDCATEKKKDDSNGFIQSLVLLIVGLAL